MQQKVLKDYKNRSYYLSPRKWYNSFFEKKIFLEFSLAQLKVFCLEIIYEPIVNNNNNVTQIENFENTYTAIFSTKIWIFKHRVKRRHYENKIKKMLVLKSN